MRKSTPSSPAAVRLMRRVRTSGNRAGEGVGGGIGDTKHTAGLARLGQKQRWFWRSQSEGNRQADVAALRTETDLFVAVAADLITSQPGRGCVEGVAHHQICPISARTMAVETGWTAALDRGIGAGHPMIIELDATLRQRIRTGVHSTVPEVDHGAAGTGGTAVGGCCNG